jgi:glycosyltransferase involved in cell wall biosynthesis
VGLRVLILKDTLSAKSGATKLTFDIAKSFLSSGDSVRIVFFHDDGTSYLADLELMKQLELAVEEDNILFRISQLVQMPIFKLFLKDAFQVKDAINIFGLIKFARKINTFGENVDIIICMSIWTGIFSVFLKHDYRRRIILYFHEPPTFSGLPFPIRAVLKLYLSKLVKISAVNISITDKMRDSIRLLLGFETYVVKDYFTLNEVRPEKDDFVLLDTRWTFIRNPFFVLNIMKLVPDVKFVMCGTFGSSELKAKFIQSICREKLNHRISILDDVTEDELNDLYSRARCYIRWSNPDIVENGPSYGLIQSISNGCVPIVSSELGSADDVLEHMGREFVVSNTPEGFASTIRRLFSDRNFLNEAVERALRWRNSYTEKDYREALLEKFDKKHSIT